MNEPRKVSQQGHLIKTAIEMVRRGDDRADILSTLLELQRELRQVERILDTIREGLELLP